MVFETVDILCFEVGMVLLVLLLLGGEKGRVIGFFGGEGDLRGGRREEMGVF